LEFVLPPEFSNLTLDFKKSIVLMEFLGDEDEVYALKRSHFEAQFWER